MTQMPSPHGPFESRLSPARVPFVWANFCYAVVSSDRRGWKREVEMTARVMLLAIGGVGGVTTLVWYLMRFVSKSVDVICLKSFGGNRLQILFEDCDRGF